MAGITLTTSPDYYQDWIEKRMADLNRLQQLQSEMQQKQSDLSKLISDKDKIDHDIADIEKKIKEAGGDESKLKPLREQLAALQDEAAGKKAAIDELTQKIQACMHDIEACRSELSALNRDTTAHAMQDLMRDVSSRGLKQQAQKDAQPVITPFDHLQKLCEQAREQEKARLEKQALEAANQTCNATNQNEKISTTDLQTAAKLFGQLHQELAAEAYRLSSEIVTEKGNAAAAATRKQEATDRRNKLWAELAAATAAMWLTCGASSGLVAYLSYELDKAYKDIEAAEKEEARANQVIHDDMVKLFGVDENGNIRTDGKGGIMGELLAISQAEFRGDIEKIIALVQEFLNLVITGGKADKNRAVEIMTLILGLLSKITAQAGAKKAEDEHWMSHATTESFQVALQDSIENLKKVAEMLEYAAFMKTYMEVVKYAMIMASIAMATATGGAGAAGVAALMGILMACGVFDECSKAIADKLEKAGCKDAKIVADVITTVIATVATLGATAAVSAASRAMTVAMARIAESIAATVAEKAAESAAAAVQQTAEKVVAEAVRQAVQSAISAAAAAGMPALTPVQLAAIEQAAKKAAETVVASAVEAAKEAARAAVKSATAKVVAEGLEKASLATLRAIAAKATGDISWIVSQSVKQQLEDVGVKAALKAVNESINFAIRAAENAAQSTLKGSVALVDATTRAFADSAAHAIRNGIPAFVSPEFFTREVFREILDEAAKICKDMGLKGWAATVAASVLSTGMMIDLIESIARQIKKKEDLDNDMAYQITMAVFKVLNSVAIGLLVGKMSGGPKPDVMGGVENTPAKDALIKLLSKFQLVGDGLSFYGNVEMSETMFRQGHAHERIAYDEEAMTIYQSVMERMKKVQEATGEVRAALFEQQMKAVTDTVKHVGDADRELAKILAERAV